MISKIHTSLPGILDVCRARRDELNLSHETIDHLAGFPAGYTSKLLAPVPIRGISYMSLSGLLGALALALVVVEDSIQREKVEDRWVPRKRVVTKRSVSGALLATESNPMLPSTNASGDKHVVQTTFEFSPEARACRSDQGRCVGRPASGEPVSFEPDRGRAGGAPGCVD